MEKIKKFEDVTNLEECFKIANMPNVKTVAEIPEEMHQVIMAFYHHAVLAKAANQLRNPSIKPDCKDRSQKKWFAWLYWLSSGGVAFNAPHYHIADAYSGDSSRFAFLDESDVRHAFNIAPDVFEDFLTK